MLGYSKKLAQISNLAWNFSVHVMGNVRLLKKKLARVSNLKMIAIVQGCTWWKRCGINAEMT